MRDVRNKRNLKSYTSIEDLKQELNPQPKFVRFLFKIFTKKRDRLATEKRIRPTACPLNSLQDAMKGRLQWNQNLIQKQEKETPLNIY